MRIGVLAHNYPPHPGGLEVMVESVASRLAQRHEVIVVTAAWDGMRGVEERGRLRIHRLPAWHSTESWGVPYPVPYGPGLVEAIRELVACDVLHAHGALYAGSMLCAGLARSRRLPMLLTEHVGFVPYSSALVVGMERLAWSLVGDAVVGSAGAIVTYNARVRAWMCQRFPRREIDLVGNGVDTVRFRPLDPDERRRARAAFGLPPDDTLVLYVGRATEKKHFSSVETIPREGFQLVVCGANRRLEAPGLVDLGVVPHARMAELYGAVDLFVLPSVGEGFPLSLQESMASGCPPVVLWDPGYVASLDRDQVASCDRLEEIGPTVLSLVRDAARRRERADQARRWAERSWSWDATVGEYERRFERLVSR
ncbi:MAG TPA: glycosyltransferase family 4 protein [Myxococcaceae bacterium]|nr:glycosyltransferase family 4 protein [Myxococcaceae bacterium]